MASFVKSKFSGGMFRRGDGTSVGDNEYLLLRNGRAREFGLQAIKLPERVTDSNITSLGHFQGCYAAGDYLLVFRNGQAYYKAMAGPNQMPSFQSILGFSMNSQVDYIYVELVPGSSVNFARDGSDDGLNLALPVASSPACAVVQDGINRPSIIFPNGTHRKANTYVQWSHSNREYVPIGTLMAFQSGVLYIAGKDQSGNLTNIFRSVSGRPLDFMVQINNEGNKVFPTDELAGGAPSVSHRVSFDPITALNRLNASDGSFYVGTKKASYIVTPRLDRLIFGEPTFMNQPFAMTGALNQFSLVELLGDHAFIDVTGLRRFNAVLQLKNEGKNSPFSADVESLLADVEQDESKIAAVEFDNYAMFALNTIHGQAIVVFDTIMEKYVSVDLYPNVEGSIKQFTRMLTSDGKRKLFAITESGLYELFASDVTARAGVYFGELTTGDPKDEHKPQSVSVVFSDIEEQGELKVTLVSDNVNTQEQVRQINVSPGLPPNPTPMPFAFKATDKTKTLSFNFDQSSFSWKFGFWVEWDFKALLTHLRCDTNTDTRRSTLQQQAKMML